MPSDHNCAKSIIVVFGKTGTVVEVDRREMRYVITGVAVFVVASGCNAASIHSEEPPYDARPRWSVDASSVETEDLSPERPMFRPHIQRDFETTGCSGCHGRGTLPFRLVHSPVTDDEWRASYDEAIAQIGDGASTPLIDKPLGGGGHPIVFRVGSEVPVRWAAWIADGAPYQPGEVAGGALPDGGSGEAGGDPITWAAVLAVLSSQDCMRCHGDEGGYSLETLDGAMGPGSDDVPNVVPGDPSSVLVQYCRDGHQGIGYRDALLVLSWVVEWSARPE